MAYIGETTHNYMVNKRNGRTAIKKACWASWKQLETASSKDLQQLIKEMLDVCNEYAEHILAQKTATVVTAWAETVIPENGEDTKMNDSQCMSWLIGKLTADSRTRNIYSIQRGDNKQLWVLVDHASADVQYEYTGYLINAMDKFGYFSCDVIVMPAKEFDVSLLPVSANRLL